MFQLFLAGVRNSHPETEATKVIVDIKFDALYRYAFIESRVGRKV